MKTQRGSSISKTKGKISGEAGMGTKIPQPQADTLFHRMVPPDITLARILSMENILPSPTLFTNTKRKYNSVE